MFSRLYRLALCVRLLDLGKKIVGIDNHNSYYDPDLKENRLKRFYKHKNYPFEIDISDKDSIKEAFENYEPNHVVNLAQAGVRYSIENPLAYIESNIVGFTNILSVADITKLST